MVFTNNSDGDGLNTAKPANNSEQMGSLGEPARSAHITLETLIQERDELREKAQAAAAERDAALNKLTQCVTGREALEIQAYVLQSDFNRAVDLLEKFRSNLRTAHEDFRTAKREKEEIESKSAGTEEKLHAELIVTRERLQASIRDGETREAQSLENGRLRRELQVSLEHVEALKRRKNAMESQYLLKEEQLRGDLETLQRAFEALESDKNAKERQ